MTGVEGGSPKDAAAASVTASSTINIYGGKWLYTQSGYSDAWSTLADSASYRYGTSSQKDGFITCGHGWDVGDSVYYGNTYLGKITYKWRNEYVDVAFVESSHYSTGRMLSSSGPYVTSRGNPTSGATIYMYGANGVKSGKVINTNIDGWWSST
ncbi:MAG TPA: hypothetical protein VN626_07170, partial [Clostridia bacterium]|nr:hypothetical protein [Clostridia bacterium]